jgi:hypothetical protein
VIHEKDNKCSNSEPGFEQNHLSERLWEQINVLLEEHDSISFPDRLQLRLWLALWQLFQRCLFVWIRYYGGTFKTPNPITTQSGTYCSQKIPRQWFFFIQARPPFGEEAVFAARRISRANFDSNVLDFWGKEGREFK